MITASTFNACQEDMQTADEQLQSNVFNGYARAYFNYALHSIERYDAYLEKGISMEAGNTEEN